MRASVKAAEIVAAVTAIAKERGLSEEEAYEVFLHGKTRKEQVQEQAKHMVLRKVRSMPGCWLGVRRMVFAGSTLCRTMST